VFNVQVLNDAVAELSEAGREQIQKMIDSFEEYKAEVVRLTDVAEGFEQLSIQLQKDKEHMQEHLDLQAEKITNLTTSGTDGVEVIKPKEEFIDSAHSITEEKNYHV